MHGGLDSIGLKVHAQANLPPCLSQHNSVLFTRATTEHFVHILERSALGLRQTKVHPNHTSSEKHSEEDICTPSPGLQHGRHVECDGEVVQPVTRCADRGALRSDRKREYLADQCPAHGTPCGSKSSDIDPDEGNHCPADVAVCDPVVLELGD